MNSFIVTYNPYSLYPTANQILNHLDTSKFVNEFYTPYAGTILIKSTYDFATVNKSFLGFFDASMFLVIQFDKSFTNGNLPQEVWTWINFDIIPTPVVQTPNALGGTGGLIR